MSTPPSTKTTKSVEFAALLRAHRRARGLTQEELAARAGISVRSLGYLERDEVAHRPRRDTLRLLIQALALADDEAARLRAAARPTQPPAEPAPAASTSIAPASSAGALPGSLTALIGREHEEAAAVHLLTRDATRLLTLTGPAGVGKTRLAIQVAATLRDEHGWAVHFTGLAAIHEPRLVLSAIARTFGIADAGTRPVHDALVAALAQRALLLVLDNLEQILAAAPDVADLLSACPHLKVLATSRAPLNVRGEQTLMVPPLALADPRRMMPVEQVEQVASVALFLERARAAAPDFALEPSQRSIQMAQIAGICQRVDGLPLAIELAAARIRHLTLEELAAGLAGDQALAVLSGGGRDLADHQRTMRSTIAWSYALLAPEEQRLFRALGVFAGGANVESVQAVARVDADGALTGLSALVDSGLVRRSDHLGESRYQQLVIVRAFALEQLRAAGEWEETRQRLADYCLGLTELVDLRVVNQPGEIYARIDTEYENIRAALAWARETGAIAHGLRLAGGLRRFWFSRFQEGQEWLEYFVAHAATPTTSEEMGVLAEAWTGVMVIAHRQGRFERACEAGEQALALRRAQGDKSFIASAMMNLGNPLTALHDYDRALALYEECLALNRETNDRQGMVFPLMNLGELYYTMDRQQQALAYYEESLAISREVGENDWSRALTWNNLAEVYVVLDEPIRAITMAEPNYRLFVKEGDAFGIATCALTLGRAEWRIREAANARAHLDEAERIFRDLGNPTMVARVRYFRASLALDHGDLAAARDDLTQAIVDLDAQPRASEWLGWIIERVGTLACQRGNMDAATRLCAAAMQQRDAVPGPVDPAERDLRARDWAAITAALDPAALASASAAGQAMTLDTALALAREELAAAR